jgi:hypothetical protein
MSQNRWKGALEARFGPAVSFLSASVAQSGSTKVDSPALPASTVAATSLRSGPDFSDGCYKKFVLDGVNMRIYRLRIDSDLNAV